MRKIPQIARSMQKVLNEEAKRAGYISGFVQRESKLTAALFAQTLVFGFMSKASASLEELRQTASVLGLKISTQGLDERFTESASECLRRILIAAMSQVIKVEPVELEILQRFNGVKLFDSTTIQLPIELAEIWQGCGGSKGINSAMKLDVCLDLTNGELSVVMLDGYAHEGNSILQRKKMPPGSLRIADLGYWKRSCRCVNKKAKKPSGRQARIKSESESE